MEIRIAHYAPYWVSVDIVDKVYEVGEVGRKAADCLKSSLQVLSDAILPKWNYVVSPNH